MSSTGEIATWLGLTSGGVGAIGCFLGGYFTDKLGRKNRRWYVWLPGLACMAAVPFALMVYWLNNYTLALLINIVPAFLGTMYLGPTIAMTHGIVSQRMRAVASAVLFFVLNLIGLGLGPLSVGVLSDLLEPLFSAESLRYALMIAVSFNLWSGFHYWKASKTIETDLDNAPK